MVPTRVSFRRAAVLLALFPAFGTSMLDAQAPGGRAIQVAGAFVPGEPGPLEKRANPITPENPIPRRLHVVSPVYPLEAAAIEARATIPLKITLDELGRVGEARSAGVPIVGLSIDTPQDRRETSRILESLVESAIVAVRQWAYEPPAAGPIAFGVSIAFGPDREPRIVAHGTLGASRQGVAGEIVLPPPPPPPPPAESASLPTWAEGVRRVDGSFTAPVKLKHVSPIYPAPAQEAREQGVVIIDARIEVDGRIRFARIVRSVPGLDRAALDAVMQWEFTPTLMDGSPIPVLLTVTIQFTLS